MYEELIRRLREEPLDSNKAALPIMDLCIDAAAAIENLSHRLDMAQGERDAVTRHMIELEQEVGRLREERDAAISALRQQEHFRDVTKKVEPLTNAQKIRSMSDEELAKLLCCTGWRMIEQKECLEWLQQPCGGE